MKLNLKKLMIVLTVSMLTFANLVEARSVAECVNDAKCRNTLTKALNENGHKNIADALEEIEDPENMEAINAAAAKLKFSEKLAIRIAYSQHEKKLKKIIKKKLKKKAKNTLKKK